MPPFDGPRATLCVTRYPWKTLVEPSSMPTGTETSTDFLHPLRTLTRFWSMSNIDATRRSCARAISNGFSRRCEIGASTDVTEGRVYGGYAGGRSVNGRRRRLGGPGSIG